MKRTYLTVPGQSLFIQVSGAASSGKSQLLEKIREIALHDGLLAGRIETISSDLSGIYKKAIRVTCPTPAQAHSMYLKGLDEQQRETLLGHLAALGYELT